MRHPVTESKRLGPRRSLLLLIAFTFKCSPSQSLISDQSSSGFRNLLSSNAASCHSTNKNLLAFSLKGNIKAPLSKSKTALSSEILLQSIDKFYKTSPYLAAFVTCGFKASMADFVAQKKKSIFNKSSMSVENEANDMGFDKSEEVNALNSIRSQITPQDKLDFKRNLAFVLYGGLYQGCCQEFIYNNIFPAWFGTGISTKTVLTKVLFDLGVLTPLLCLPLAYLVKALIFQYTFKEGIRLYLEDVSEHGLLRKYWMIWFPVQCLTFGVVPQHYRIAFIALISFFWLIILSSISGRVRNDNSNKPT